MTLSLSFHETQGLKWLGGDACAHDLRCRRLIICPICDFLVSCVESLMGNPHADQMFRTIAEAKDEGLDAVKPGLPWSGKNIWKMKFFPGQGKVREFC